LTFKAVVCHCNSSISSNLAPFVSCADYCTSVSDSCLRSTVLFSAAFNSLDDACSSPYVNGQYTVGLAAGSPVTVNDRLTGLGCGCQVPFTKR
jgi:hypothetical protein